MNSSKLIFWLEEIGKEHTYIVGKKCANLGEMTRMGLPVPPGFAISIDLYRKFIQETGAKKELSRYVIGLGEIKDKGIALFEKISGDIQGILDRKTMSGEVRDMIETNYKELCRRINLPNVAVSVRSAGTESRPGMFETYLNVKGPVEVLEKVKKVWASAYTTRAVAFRINKGLSLIGDELGVAVLKMVNASSAGIGFTVDPVTGDASSVVIESNWGLGEGVVSGEGSVDRFVLDKGSLEIRERVVGMKIRQVVNKEKGAEWVEVPPEKQSIPCLKENEIREIARIAKGLEDTLGMPQDIEWAIDPDFSFPHNIFLLQTRPAKVVIRTPQSTTDRIIDLMAKRYRS